MATLNQDGVSVKGCSIIYAPAGQTGEYSPLAANPYRGCGHKCAYCYVPNVLRMPREEFDAGMPLALQWNITLGDLRAIRDERTQTLADYLTRQWEWSRRTFGAGYRLSQVRKHIDRELLEIDANPGDPVEWLDLALLALDGAQRFAELTPDQVMPMLLAKQQKNFARTWPIPSSEDEAVEHDRSGE